MAELLIWLTEVGTDQWLENFVGKNLYLVIIFLTAIGGFLKGKYPEFWENISTAIPFIGNPKRRI